MIPQASTAKVEGMLGGLEATGSVDEQDMQHIMQVLTDLYSNNALAVLREYSTNARDVHIKFGINRPIEVTLPSRLSNTLTIRDFGPGQSPQEMLVTYTKYGRSNKRDSAEENGFLGLGSKSALTYTTTFTVVSVKDGLKSQAVIFRDEEGLLHLNVVSSIPTDEPSGTTVTIPTKLGDNFRETARDFYKVWDKGTVLVNGETPAHISDEAGWVHLGDHYIRVNDSGYRDQSRMNVVMGNVTYAVSMPTPSAFRVGIETYTFVPNGSVKFVPSREALDLKPSTKAVVDAAWKDVGDRYLAYFKDGLNKAQTIAEAVKVFLPMMCVLGRQQGLEWRGIKLEETVRYNGRQWSHGWQNNGIGSTQMRDSISLSNAYSSTNAFLTNRTSKSSLNSGEKARLAQYLKSTNSSVTVVYFNGDDVDVFQGANKIDWQVVLTSTKSVSPTKPARSKDEWEYFTTDGTHRTRQWGPVPSGKTIIFGSNSELNLDSWNPIDLDFLNHMGPQYAWFNVALNRQEKFKRDNPGAEHFVKHLNAFIEKTRNSLSENEKLAYKAYDVGDSRLYEALAGKTDDPLIDLIHGTMGVAKVKGEKVNRILRLVRKGSFSVPGEDYISENYPLATRDYIDHSILYINYIKNGK
jgi:hypothetical protein